MPFDFEQLPRCLLDLIWYSEHNRAERPEKTESIYPQGSDGLWGFSPCSTFSLLSSRSLCSILLPYNTLSLAVILLSPFLMFTLLSSLLRQSVLSQTVQEGELRRGDEGLHSRWFSSGQSGSAVCRMEVPAVGPLWSRLAGGRQHPLSHSQPPFSVWRTPARGPTFGLPRKEIPPLWGLLFPPEQGRGSRWYTKDTKSYRELHEEEEQWQHPHECHHGDLKSKDWDLTATTVA